MTSKFGNFEIRRVGNLGLRRYYIKMIGIYLIKIDGDIFFCYGDYFSNDPSGWVDLEVNKKGGKLPVRDIGHVE